MAKVDFWALARPVQERFVASTEGAAAPAPLAIRPLARDPRSLAYSAFGVCATLAGDRPAARRLRRSEQSLRARASYVHRAVFGLLRARGRRLLHGRGSLREGLRGALPPRALPVPNRRDRRALARVRGASHLRSKPRRTSTRPVPPCASSSRALTSSFRPPTPRRRNKPPPPCSACVTSWPTPGPESSAREQSLLDPLIDNGFKNPFAPAEPLRKELPGWIKILAYFRVILGVLLGGAAFLVRNHLSEGRLYAAARRADSTEAYRTYLERGGHNPDVQALLLPRAELRDAAAQRQRRRHRTLPRRPPRTRRSKSKSKPRSNKPCSRS